MSKKKDRFWGELEELSIEYKDLLAEINREFRKEVRKLGSRKSVIPKKYILPKAYITHLLEYPQFKKVWDRKVFWIHVRDWDTQEGRWIKVQTYPNLGGVPVEEGPSLKVIVERVPRRTRRKKKK